MHVINAFWYTAIYMAKQLGRGDLWLVKIRDANTKIDVCWIFAVL
ncbi:hypothetical protein ACFL6S_12040 [Candidatus Poribacteria bacterium]